MPPFPSVLIANRGEIACRVIHTARLLGMRTIAVYSEADAKAKHVALADEAYPIGPAPARESYLVIDKIIEVAKRAGAASIHPGYGFLSERAEFAEACAAAGIVFVGPPPTAIRAMGLKGEAKALMQRAGVPTVPGYHGDKQEPDFLREKAYEVGYPVLIKAVAGGGGKGMRRVDRVLDFDAALESAVREAKNAFGDGRVLVEKYVQQPRHVEIQVFGDRHGNVVHLFERDCSLQRRHQKVVEEAPAPGMTPAVREAMGRAAVAAAAAVGYVGAGTVEFIADGSKGLRPDGFWFMEMNTRLQVEHPVTEAITGLDLVELQFRVAAGEPLPFTQDDLAIDGHAVEARLYAEDPRKNFLPSTGDIHRFAVGGTPDGPPLTEFAPSTDGVRVDSGLWPVDRVSPFYDPMIAKVVAHGANRDEALDRLSTALADLELWGPRSNAAFLCALADHPDFRAGRFDTGFIDARLDELVSSYGVADEAALRKGLAALLREQGRTALQLAIARSPAGYLHSPWDALDAFQLSGPRQLTYRLEVDGEPRDVVASGAVSEFDTDPKEADPAPVGGGFYINLHPGQCFIRFPDPAAALELAEHGGDGVISAPMHGKLTALFVEAGQAVAKGDRLFIVEAMKMEHAVHAPIDGTIAEVLAEAGAQVGEGARLVVIEVTEGGAAAPAQ